MSVFVCARVRACVCVRSACLREWLVHLGGAVRNIFFTCDTGPANKKHLIVAPRTSISVEKESLCQASTGSVSLSLICAEQKSVSFHPPKQT